MSKPRVSPGNGSTTSILTRGFDIGFARAVQLSGGLEYRRPLLDLTPRCAWYANGGYIFQPGDQPGDPNLGKPAAIGAQAGVVLSPADEARLTRS